MPTLVDLSPRNGCESAGKATGKNGHDACCANSNNQKNALLCNNFGEDSLFL